MNEEVSRILKMLEDGKISAEAAERLIRALKETGGAEGGGRTRQWTCTGTQEAPDVLRKLIKSFRVACRRQRRTTWLRYYRYAEYLANQRRQRRGQVPIAERLGLLFSRHGLADPEELTPHATLEDLHFDAAARELLRYALREEFEVSISAEEVEAFRTYGDVIRWVEEHATAAAPAPESAHADTPAAEAAQSAASPESSPVAPSSEPPEPSAGATAPERPEVQ
jgi:acyl carrier protein